MSITFSSPVTGGPQTGLTSPTYTVVADQAPDSSTMKQIYVSALGGTQTGVTTHTATSPFTGTFWRPKIARLLGALGLNGQYANIPKNEYGMRVRKGVSVAADQPIQLMQIAMTVSVPAGAETYDSANVRAALSFAAGLLTQQSSGFGDSLVIGSLG